ncbi:MAG: protoheme IX farnesyltransferase [Thermoprotei archaeon]
MGLARDVVAITKMPQTAVLTFTALIGYMTPRAPFSAQRLFIVLISELAAISGTTMVNMYHDKDIDIIMSRTKARPIPSGRMAAPAVLAWGYLLFCAGLLLSLLVSYVFALTIFAGYAFDIWVYTLALKRRSVWNIVFGGVAGAMPILGGWVARTGSVGLGGILMFSLIMFWIPLHTWVIALINREDYKKACIPMASLTSSANTVFLLLFFTLAAFFFVTVEMALIGITTFITPLISGVMIALLMSLIYRSVVQGATSLLRPSQMIAHVFLLTTLLSILMVAIA